MNNKYTVYSILVGTYDEIRQPLSVDGRFDYILFSDAVTVDRIGIWQVRPIPYHDEDRMRLSRFAKCHPTKVLPEYEASLYIDANIQIATSDVYERFIDLFERGVEWGGVKHPSQSCVYEEICTILTLQWVHDYDVVDWYARLKNEGFPEQWGLFENNVIFRRHNKLVEEIGERWWKTLEHDCKRDQFSLMYVLWSLEPRLGYITEDEECPRTGSRNYNYYEHNPHKRIVKLGLHEKIRNRCMRVAAPDVRIGYHELFDMLSDFRHPKRMLMVWECYAIFKYGPRVLYRNLRYKLTGKL